MDVNQADGRQHLIEQTDAFLLALRATPVVTRFLNARRRFEDDPEVRGLLDEFQRRANAFKQAQETGNESVDVVRDVRVAQANVQEHPIVREFSDARAAVATLFQQTNEVISEVLGVDFGQTAGPARGCCG